MWGLRLMDNNYIPFGDGRDFYYIKNKEYERGRADSYRDPPGYQDRQCKPRQFKIGPKPPGKQRVDQMTKGQWQTSGEWATATKSLKSLPRSSSAPGVPRKGYDGMMQTWLQGRQRDLSMTPGCLRSWQNQSCRADVRAPSGVALPALFTEPEYR
eukprot:gb/GFBE01025470.1/.p1 GENE.gb/GFBE01025470.1/~~gb/GFBE01025470.1/.p1  ORF type:complete len:155 (+),score=23.69 gb/GFBE01025470.1/:1-465(+)